MGGLAGNLLDVYLGIITTCTMVRPALANRAVEGECPARCEVPITIAQSASAAASQAPVNDCQHAGPHLGRHLPVVRADRAAVVFPAPTGMVTHQLVDYPSQDAAVLQPGREGVSQVVRAMQVQSGEAGVGSSTGLAEVQDFHERYTAARRSASQSRDLR
jgi:hypothetical protein